MGTSNLDGKVSVIMETFLPGREKKRVRKFEEQFVIKIALVDIYLWINRDSFFMFQVSTCI